jgi:hypothetical protein
LLVARRITILNRKGAEEGSVLRKNDKVRGGRRRV